MNGPGGGLPRLTPKQIVCEMLGCKPKSVRVRRGRGTAYGWISISTPIRVPQSMRDKIEKRLVREGLASTHWPDCLPGKDDPYTPSVGWYRWYDMGKTSGGMLDFCMSG